MASARSSGPVRVGDLLVAAVPGLREHLLEETIRKEWPRAVGPELARRSRPVTLRLGTLTVAVDNSTWLQEMTLRSEELVRRLQARYGPEVRVVRVALDSAPSSAREKRARE